MNVPKNPLFRPSSIMSITVALLALCETAAAAHVNPDSTFSTLVRPGVTHKRILDDRGPWIVNILEIDLTRPDLEIGAGRAFDRFFGREQTSSIAQRNSRDNRTVVAAMNADFFNLKTGEIENNNIIDGVFVKGTPMTGSPFDTFDNNHSQFAISSDKKPLIDRFAFEGMVIWSNGVSTPLLGVNDIPKSQSLILFNDYYGPSTPTDTLRLAIRELPLTSIGMRFDTLMAIVAGQPSHGGTSISKGSVVLSAYDQNQAEISSAKKGDTVKIWMGVAPDRGQIRTMVGGWPRVVLNGRNIAGSADSLEGTFPRFSANRHPRSGVGFSKDSTKVYFIIVDGRSQTSVGMSLVEFADLMLSAGIYQGMNLDGGGSTSLVINGKIVNSPTDPTGERPVGNCLLLFAIKQK